MLKPGPGTRGPVYRFTCRRQIDTLPIRPSAKPISSRWTVQVCRPTRLPRDRPIRPRYGLPRISDREWRIQGSAGCWRWIGSREGIGRIIFMAICLARRGIWWIRCIIIHIWRVDMHIIVRTTDQVRIS